VRPLGLARLHQALVRRMDLPGPSTTHGRARRGLGCAAGCDPPEGVIGFRDRLGGGMGDAGGRIYRNLRALARPAAGLRDVSRRPAILALVPGSR